MGSDMFVARVIAQAPAWAPPDDLCRSLEDECGDLLCSAGATRDFAAVDYEGFRSRFIPWAAATEPQVVVAKLEEYHFYDAAIALASATGGDAPGDDPRVAGVRVAANACADEHARVALEGASRGAVDERELERAIEAVEQRVSRA